MNTKWTRIKLTPMERAQIADAIQKYASHHKYAGATEKDLNDTVDFIEDVLQNEIEQEAGTDVGTGDVARD